MKRKLLSLALALAMCLGLTIPALAAEVQSDKCTYELSNDPIGTVEIETKEINANIWNPETGDYENRTVTLYIVPDGTTVKSKTVPNGKLPYSYCILDEYLEWAGGEYANVGEPLVIQPFKSVTYWNEGGPDIEKQVTCIFKVQSEDLDFEYYEPYNPYPLDEGIFIMAQSAATAAGFAVQGTTTPSTPTTPTTPSTGFTDVKASDYFATPVAWAVEKGITNGTGNNQFSPNQNCTNAQILTFLWRAYGQPEPTISNPFTNTIPEAYTKAAIWAYEKGMVSGTTFDVEGLCSRSMAVTYMWQAAGSPTPATTATFTDVPDGTTFTTAVSWAVEKGITTGTSSTTFSPNDICTRGQIATFLHRNLA